MLRAKSHEKNMGTINKYDFADPYDSCRSRAPSPKSLNV